MNEISVTHVHCWISVRRSRRNFWSRVWGLDKAKLKVDYLGAIPVESAVVGDALADSRGQLFVVVSQGKIRNFHSIADEFHLPDSLTFLYRSHTENNSMSTKFDHHG